MKIPTDKIVIPDIRVSAKYNEEQLQWLKASIQQLGVIQDPVVRPLPDGRYEVVAGAHRIKELIASGAKEIECKVVEADDKRAIAMNITENLARGTYDPIEVSKQLRNYIEHGGTIDELVKMTGHTREWVQLYLNLTELPEVYQQALSEGKLRIGHVAKALELDDPREIDAALSTALNLEWPVSVLEKYVERRKAELEEARRAQQNVPPPPPPTLEQAQEMVRYSVCGVCRRQVDNRYISVPGICQECLEFCRYATTLLGTGREAMNRLYNAVSHYHQFLQMQAQVLQQFRPALPPAPPQQPPEKKEEASSSQ
jgi:ParB family chromosome partitioning protein